MATPTPAEPPTATLAASAPTLASMSESSVALTVTAPTAESVEAAM